MTQPHVRSTPLLRLPGRAGYEHVDPGLVAGVPGAALLAVVLGGDRARHVDLTNQTRAVVT